MESDNESSPRDAQTVAADIRVGSPFLAGTHSFRPLDTTLAESSTSLADLGSFSYTAMGAVVASVMVLAFAIASVIWFPLGGVLVAALGSLLALLGLFSQYRYSALGLLAAHMMIFVASYVRTWG